MNDSDLEYTVAGLQFKVLKISITMRKKEGGKRRQVKEAP